jgi:hypothetical protein
MQEVPQTILEQLGGNKFISMTGAYNFIAGEIFLGFKLPSQPNFVKSGINYVEIALTPMDDYTMIFANIKGVTYTEIAMVDRLYFDQLQEVFTEHTGLDTKL